MIYPYPFSGAWSYSISGMDGPANALGKRNCPWVRATDTAAGANCRESQPAPYGISTKVPICKNMYVCCEHILEYVPDNPSSYDVGLVGASAGTSIWLIE